MDSGHERRLTPEAGTEIAGELLSLISDAVVATDARQRVIVWNGAAEQLFGCSAAEAIGQPLGSIYQCAWESEQAERDARASLRERGRWRGDALYTRRDGGQIWAEAQLTIRHDARGEQAGVLAIIRDSSARRSAEAALRASERRAIELVAEMQAMQAELRASELRYRTLSARTTDYAYALRVAPGAPTVFEWADGSFASMTGIRLEDVSAIDMLLELADPADRAALREHIDTLLSGHESVVEVRLLARGQQRWVQDRAWPERDSAGQVVRVLGAGQDITDRKLYELQLEETALNLGRLNEELAHAGRLKDEFLASMSHELRTPLSAILSTAEAIQEETYGPVAPAQRQAIAMIERSGSHLLELINDILDLAKIEAGALEFQPELADIDQLCRECAQLIAPAAAQRHLSVSIAIAPELGRAYVDTRRLRQILVNLLSNAIKFTPDGGSVGLDVGYSGEQLRLCVWDTGIGIAPEQLPRLFKPFVQLDSRLARRYTGTGLGLAMVARLAELHGGSVSVESEPARGSRFCVTIPLRHYDSPAHM